MSAESTLEAARGRDASDPLRGFRARFALPRDAHGEPLVYLCGHSLGLLPLAARELVIESSMSGRGSAYRATSRHGDRGCLITRTSPPGSQP